VRDADEEVVLAVLRGALPTPRGSQLSLQRSGKPPGIGTVLALDCRAACADDAADEKHVRPVRIVRMSCRDGGESGEWERGRVVSARLVVGGVQLEPAVQRIAERMRQL